MKSLQRLAKKSAKNVFIILRDKQLLYCTELETSITVTKLFFNHIVNNSKKKRSEYEIIEQILIISFIEKILKKGKITQIRNEEYGKTYRIVYQTGFDILCIVLLQSKGKYLLLSCFRKTSIYKKRTLS